jgi:hypothetical protein
MGAKTSFDIASFRNSEFCQNYTVMEIESPNEPIHNDDDDDDDEMPPLEPIRNDEDESSYVRSTKEHRRDACTNDCNVVEASDVQCTTIESNPSPIVFTNDTIVNTVIESFISRSNLGFKKYKNTLDREDLSTVEWVNHAQEELMDAILYLERLKKNLQK